MNLQLERLKEKSIQFTLEMVKKRLDEDFVFEIIEGRMEGGFSLRYHRSKLPGEKQKEFDEYVGVKEYL